MNTVFSTNGISPRDRFDCWHEAAHKYLVDHESVPDCRQTFQAELQAGELGDLGLFLVANAPMTVTHTARHVAHANPDELLVCRQVAGTLALEQDSREVCLEAGDITLLDPRSLYSGKFSAESRLLVLMTPRRLLEARVGKARPLTARIIRPSEGEGSLTSAFLGLLPRHVGGLGPVAEKIVSDQMLDLVAVSLAKAMEGEKPRLSSARSFILLKVRAVIDAQLTNPTLDAKTVAAAAGVSVRYANAVLAEENTSIMRLIQARRLARCRRALEDPGQAHRTVSEIAYRWGFSDMTHFGRT